MIEDILRKKSLLLREIKVERIVNKRQLIDAY